MRHRSPLLAPCLFALVFGLLACEAPPPPDGPEVTTGTLLYEASTFQSSGKKSIAIVDAAVEGQKVAVLIATSTTTFSDNPTMLLDPYGNYAGELPGAGGSTTSVGQKLAWSEDLGASWQLLEPPGTNYYGVVLLDGRVLLLQFVAKGSVLGETWHMQVVEYDRKSGKVQNLGPLLDGSRAVFSGHHLTLYDHQANQTAADPDKFPNNVDGYYRWQRLDLKTGALEKKVQPFTAGEYRCRRPARAMVSLDSAFTFHGFSTCQTPQGRQVCHLVAQPSPVFANQPDTAQLKPEEDCAAAIDRPFVWQPIAIQSGTGTVAAAEAVGDEILLWRWPSGQAPQALPLGKGTFHEPSLNFGVRQRYGRLVTVTRPQEDDKAKVAQHFRVTDQGPAEQMPFRDTLCSQPGVRQANGKVCGGSVTWALRLPGKDEKWLTFYALHTHDPTDLSVRRWVHFYSLVQTVVPQPVTFPAPANTADAYPGCYPDLVAATDLERACLKLASTCPPLNGFSVGTCVGQWLKADPAARAAFAKSPPACPTDGWWKTPAPVVKPATCKQLSATCLGPTIEMCTASADQTLTIDCGAIGGACTPTDPITGAYARCGQAVCPALGWMPTTVLSGDWTDGVCQGDRVVVRVEGVVRVLSCSELGLGPCEKKPGRPYAACAKEAPPSPDRLKGGLPAGVLEQACARVVGCLDVPVTESWAWQQTLEACVEAGLIGNRARDDAHDTIWQALLAAKTCADLRAALPNVLPNGGACEGGKPWACVGSVATQCNDGKLGNGIDCGAFGAVCQVQGESATCAPPPGACANAGIDQVGCSTAGACYGTAGKKVDEWGVERTFSACKARGLTCVGLSPTASVVDCAVIDAVCTASTPFACLGGTLLSCHGKNIGAPMRHCGRLPGFACQGGDVGKCQPKVSDCTAAAPGRCDGNVLRTCLFGSTRALDCSTIGATCQAGAQGARCVASGP